MPLHIAFIGYNALLTVDYFRQFALDNFEAVRYFDSRRGRITLYDGTTIQAISRPMAFRDGVRFDQVILADDRRMRILYTRWEEIAWLRHVTSYSEIPEEFRFQVYDIDADPPRG